MHEVFAVLGLYITGTLHAQATASLEAGAACASHLPTTEYSIALLRLQPSKLTEFASPLDMDRANFETYAQELGVCSVDRALTSLCFGCN
jgi:hypothetical protein